MARDFCIIVPTVRHHRALDAYVANARHHRFDTSRLHVLILTEDGCDTADMRKMLDEHGLSGDVFDATARSEWFRAHKASDQEDLVPKRSHAETSFGLLWMATRPEFKFGAFLDDDTQPYDLHDWFGAHLNNLGRAAPVRTLASTTKWVNVLHDHHDRHKLYPRGFPYAAMKETYTVRSAKPKRIVASQGLWTDVPDLDAVRILQDGDLNGQPKTLLTPEDFGAAFTAEKGHYLTVSSMNLAFRREVIPAFYQLPMDDNPWRIGRFDDIWSGVLLKRAADVLGHTLLTGAPLCRHLKAPRSTFKDLASEAPALELNEHLWEVAEGVACDPQDGYAGAARALALALEKGEFAKWTNGAFLNYAGERLRRWVDLCEKLGARS